MNRRTPEDIFNDALEFEGPRLREYLDEVCGGDAQLRAEVDSLLEVHHEYPSTEAPSWIHDISHKHVGRYHIIRELGRGGMGRVYLATDPKLGREVAIKVLPQRRFMGAARFDRFRREAQILARLNHPNISTLHSLEESDGIPFLTLEVVSGESLAEKLAAGPPSIDETLAICRQIAAALEAAHRLDIVHRDLKPSNVKLTHDGRVKVLDFGLAKVTPRASDLDAASMEHAAESEADEESQRSKSLPLSISAPPSRDTSHTEVGTILGSPGYMSPEQLRGEAVGVAADVWAFGCILYECLSGHAAFPGATAAERIEGARDDAPDWGALPAEMPSKLLELLRGCLDKKPEARPESGSLLREAIERIEQQATSGTLVGTTPEPTPGEKTMAVPGSEPRVEAGSRKSWFRKRSVIVGTSGLGLLMAILVVWILGWIAASRGPLEGIRFRQLTFSGEVWEYDIAPDGDRVAYTDRSGRLMVREIEKLREHEPFPGFRTSMAIWSPDGREILLRDIEPPFRSYIGTLGDPQPTPIGPERWGPDDWSPDGESIVGRIGRGTGPYLSLIVVHRDSDEQKLIDMKGVGIRGRIDWYPGPRPLVSGTKGDVRGVWVIPEGDGHPVLVDGIPGNCRWSPQGRGILSKRSTGDESTTLLWRRLDAQFQPTGPFQTLATFKDRGEVAIAEKRVVLLKDSQFSTLWLLRRSGEEWRREKLLSGSRRLRQPRLSPDRASVAVLAKSRTNKDLIVIDTKTVAQRTLRSEEPGLEWPAWSPDGKSLVYGTKASGGPNLGIVSLESGNGQSLAGTTGSEYVYWHPSRRIRYQRTAERHRNYTILDVQRDEESSMLLIDDAGTVFQSALSPDETLLAVAGNRGGEVDVRPWLIRLADQKEDLLWDRKAAPIGWSADGRWVYLVLEEPTPEVRGITRAKVMRVPIDSGDAQLVITLPNGDLSSWSDLDISPDGSTIVCVLNSSITDLWSTNELELTIP
ncbi:MAG: protein kinase [Candidatus Latescibacteria bacterium]|nr:protein kinase [Candidatus Latescibacterota bacterium]